MIITKNLKRMTLEKVATLYKGINFLLTGDPLVIDLKTPAFICNLIVIEPSRWNFRRDNISVNTKYICR